MTAEFRVLPVPEALVGDRADAALVRMLGFSRTFTLLPLMLTNSCAWAAAGIRLVLRAVSAIKAELAAEVAALRIQVAVRLGLQSTGQIFLFLLKVVLTRIRLA